MTFFWIFVLETQCYYIEVLKKNNSVDFLAIFKIYLNVFFGIFNRNRFNSYNVSRVGLHAHFLNIAPLFAPDWFANAFIAILGFPCFLLVSRGIQFSIFLFLQ